MAVDEKSGNLNRPSRLTALAGDRSTAFGRMLNGDVTFSGLIIGEEDQENPNRQFAVIGRS
jgi:hypothetical protein